VRIATGVLSAVVALALAGCGEDEESTTTEARLSPEQEIERIGNKWAALFAADAHSTGRYMSQPALERMTCERISGPIENCTPPTPAFRESFEDATVQDVEIKGEHAGAKFSNGEAVQLDHAPGPDLEHPQRLDTWFINRFGGNAGREFFD
jgi:hypothetical protein